MIGGILARRGALALAAGQAVAAQSAQLATRRRRRRPGCVHLRGLDTLAGRAVDIDAARSARPSASAGSRSSPRPAGCRATTPPPTPTPSWSIRDVREDTPRFSGWMFASSPALSALDHPRYDVWVVSCDG